MALLPPIPARPADRPESWSEYLRRRAMITLCRQQSDAMATCLRRDPAQWHWGLSLEPLRFGILQDAAIDFTFEPRKCRDR